MSEEKCDHIVEIADDTFCGHRTIFIKQSESENINRWRDYVHCLLKCDFCPKCGEELKDDEIPVEDLVAAKEALEKIIAERL